MNECPYYSSITEIDAHAGIKFLSVNDETGKVELMRSEGLYCALDPKELHYCSQAVADELVRVLGSALLSECRVGGQDCSVLKGEFLDRTSR